MYIYIIHICVYLKPKVQSPPGLHGASATLLASKGRGELRV